MKKFNLLFSCSLLLIAVTSCETSEQKIEKIDSVTKELSQIDPIINDVVITEMSQAYGFNEGQNYSLEFIKKKYPELAPQVQIAKLRFEKSFESSLVTIDSILLSKGDEWLKIKDQQKAQIKESVNLNNYSYDQMKNFISTVERRADGEIPDPIIGTLLTFNPRYLKNPELEFNNGFKYRFESSLNEKSKNVDFQLDIPHSWLSKEANRPNIVQKFISQNGRGSSAIMVSVFSLPSDHNVTEEDIKELAASEEMKDMLPKNSQLINGSFIKIDNLPGVCQEFKLLQTQIDKELLMHAINYNIYYKNKMISIQCSVVSSKNEEIITDSIFNKYRKLFNLVAGSLVVRDQWK
jgi:hypothetical protein